MNHKERVLATFQGKSVDRFPMWYGAAPELTERLARFCHARDEDDALYNILDLDFKTIRPQYVGPELRTYANGERETDWGIRRGGAHWGQAMNHPLANTDSVADVMAYKFPDPDNYVVTFTEQQKTWAKDRCVIGGTWAPFFHDSIELPGMEKMFIDYYDSPEFADAIIQRCFEFYYELDCRVFERNKGLIDMYFIGNDYGSQRALLMSPNTWRRFYKPRMKELIQQARANGCITAIHSCGVIVDIIPDLIEIGVDAINPIQVNAEGMQPERLIKEFGGDCVFFGGIDENEVLLHHTPAQVREETRRIIDLLGSKGRYVVAASHDYLLPEIPEENVFAMFDEAKKYGTGK